MASEARSDRRCRDIASTSSLLSRPTGGKFSRVRASPSKHHPHDCCCSLMSVLGMYAARCPERYAPFARVGFSRVGCPASGGSRIHRCLRRCGIFGKAEKCSIYIIFCFCSKLSSSGAKRHEVVKGGSGRCRIGCLVVIETRDFLCANTVFLRKSNTGGVSVTRSLSWGQSIHGQSPMTSMVY